MIGLEFSSKEQVDLIIQKAFDEKILLLSAGTNALRVIPPLNIEKTLLFNSLDKLIGLMKSNLNADNFCD
jgi:acetylornithine/succinyldiaminopimelate/putrescine aminotransferase